MENTNTAVNENQAAVETTEQSGENQTTPEGDKPKKRTIKEKQAAEEAHLKELVPFYAFKDTDKYRDDIIVGVNGKLFQIQRGKEVMIPRYVYNVIIQSMNQDAQTAELIEQQENAFAAETKSRNF